MMKVKTGRYDIYFAAILFLMSITAEYYEIFSWAEDQTLSFRHGIRTVFGNPEKTAFPHDRIVLVTIDDTFFENYGKFPLRRSDLAAIIRNLDKLGAVIICTDLLMEFPDSFQGDALLAETLGKNRSVLASRAVYDEQGQFRLLRYPIPELKNMCKTGYINLSSPSRVSTFLSRLQIRPEICDREDGWPLAVQAVSRYLDVLPALEKQTLILGDISIPLNHFNEMYIDFSAVPKTQRFLHQSYGISAWEFLDLEKRDEYDIMELQAWVKDKIVILGESTEVSHDWFDTPVGMIYGMEIVADTISTILKQAPLRPAPLSAEILISFLLFGSIILFTSFIRRPVLLALTAVMIPGGFIFICSFLYARYGIVVSMSYNLIAGIAAVFILSFFSYIRERKLRDIQRLEKEQARQLQKAAEIASQTKSEFLASMSHEIRTPMNSVLGFLELALEDPVLPEYQKKNLGTAHNSAKSLLAIINDILDLSKLESGKLELEHQVFDLRKMTEEAAQIFEMKCREKGLNLSCHIQPDLPRYFTGDSGRLRQILINLLGNAVKFTEKGSIKVKVMSDASSSAFQTSNFKLHFSVEDTGIGIPPDRLDNIFEPFTQADRSTSRRFGGTGLGTTISKQLVELMGGEIYAKSQECNGSTFGFKIPLKPAEGEAEIPICPDLSASSMPEMTVLLADDLEENIMLAKIRLEKAGHRVIEARNGSEAVKAFKEKNPDIILMDVQMPETDGMEAARQIRSLENGTGIHTPIIALTASIMIDERQQCLDAGMDDVAGKPIDFQALFRLMEKYAPDGQLSVNSDQLSVDCCQLTTDMDSKISHKPSIDDCSLITVHCIDREKGLETWQDESVYEKALLSFCRKYGNAAEEMLDCLKNDDREEAYGKIHALKGVAGNLCITEVFRISEKLNAEFRKKEKEELIPMIKELAEALQYAVCSVQHTESANEKCIPPVNTPKNPEEISGRMKKLPESIRNELLKAARLTDPAAAEALVKKIRVLDEILAAVLDEILDEFRFDILEDIILSRPLKTADKDIIIPAIRKAVCPPGTDKDRLKEIIRHLLLSFETYNPSEAEPVLEKLTDSLSPSHIQTIQEMLDRFDFDGAREETLKLAADLEIHFCCL